MDIDGVMARRGKQRRATLACGHARVRGMSDEYTSLQGLEISGSKGRGCSTGLSLARKPIDRHTIGMRFRSASPREVRPV